MHFQCRVSQPSPASEAFQGGIWQGAGTPSHSSRAWASPQRSQRSSWDGERGEGWLTTALTVAEKREVVVRLADALGNRVLISAGHGIGADTFGSPLTVMAAASSIDAP